MEKPRIGFIGLGIMGRHMATHLLNAGYPMVVYDIVTTAMDDLVARGASSASSCREVAQRSDVIITMVPDSPDVEAVALGRNGIIEGAHSGQIHADMSTISPQTAVRVSGILGAAGVRCLDAPVSGGQTGAQNASLSIMVGGPIDLFNEMLPVFQVLGKVVTHCGGNGAGQIVKACNQIQVTLNFVGMAEALVLGTRAGVDPSIILKVLSGGYAQTRVMDVRGPKIIAGDFSPGFKSKFHYKDLNIIMSAARDLHVPLPATSVAQALFSALLAHGGGDLDHSAVITVLEEMTGVNARTKSAGKGEAGGENPTSP
jgi:2-hydroxy-3-oxopropionate reductase